VRCAYRSSNSERLITAQKEKTKGREESMTSSLKNSFEKKIKEANEPAGKKEKVWYEYSFIFPSFLPLSCRLFK
jgi:hypothetical protein